MIPKEIAFRRQARGAALAAAFFTSASLLLVPLAGAQPADRPVKPKPGRFAGGSEATARALQGNTSGNRAGASLLGRMIQAERTLTYSAREATFGPARSTEELVRHDPVRGVRRESIRPGGEVFVDNYSRSWLLSTRAKTLTERSSPGKRTFGVKGEAIKRLLRQRLQVEIVGEERVAGRLADIVSVGADGTAADRRPSRRFWIDRETGLRLRSEDREPGGRILSGAYYLSVDLKPTFAPGDFSRPALPPGFKSVSETKQTFRSYDEASRSGVTVRRPAYLPKGFRLRSIDVTNKSGGSKSARRVSQRFDNGLSVLTFVQSSGLAVPKRSLDLLDAKTGRGFISLPRGQRAYVWRDSNASLTFALLGSVSDDELKQVADSVH
ncbi:MAG: hypothetical protein H7Z41_20130 [Cytophagales bacterium]|nr:hypothetical protein [Armatimonadota bacterium]